MEKRKGEGNSYKTTSSSTTTTKQCIITQLQRHAYAINDLSHAHTFTYYHTHLCTTHSFIHSFELKAEKYLFWQQGLRVKVKSNQSDTSRNRNYVMDLNVRYEISAESTNGKMNYFFKIKTKLVIFCWFKMTSFLSATLGEGFFWHLNWKNTKFIVEMHNSIWIIMLAFTWTFYVEYLKNIYHSTFRLR